MHITNKLNCSFNIFIVQTFDKFIVLVGVNAVALYLHYDYACVCVCMGGVTKTYKPRVLKILKTNKL